MKNIFTVKTISASLAALIAGAMLCGCGSVAGNALNTTLGNDNTAAPAATVLTGTESGGASVEKTESDVFTNRDLEQTADTDEARTVTVSDGATIEITEAGVYVVTGSASNCTIEVNAEDDAKVQLVLSNVSITNDDFPCIYVVSADKVFITTDSGSVNSLAVTGAFRADGDTNTDAVIFSKDDLTLNGEGTLNIVSNYANGIACKDDLKITGGSYSIQSTLDAIEANDSVSISDGAFTIVSGKDGIQCKNDDDDTKGSVYITGGSFEISARSDGIQGNSTVIIDGGSFNISAGEGIEGTYIEINGGDITIYATDDGINASRKSTAYDIEIVINGGNLNITMAAGDTDALDSNGSLYINGGTVNISAQFAFDFEYAGQLNGGTVYVNGTQVTSITNSMMGGMGGFGGMGGQPGGGQGGFGGGPGGQQGGGFGGGPGGRH